MYCICINSEVNLKICFKIKNKLYGDYFNNFRIFFLFYVL